MDSQAGMVMLTLPVEEENIDN